MKRILLVEDDPRVARFITKGLTAEGYRVDAVENGAAALEKATSEVYDVFLFDFMLPDKSGLEVCIELREQGIRTPLLLVTARDAVSDRVAGLRAGADDYLTKPFAFEELLARIEALVRRSSGADPSRAIRVEDLELDPRSHEVRRGERRIELTSTEFSLLEYLMRNQGRVLSRVLIEEQVWGHRADNATNVVDVYIGRLRKKIDEGAAQPLIHTVRGVGYVVKAG
ncbi:MAG: response regulator transcription factor [Deltaproteobacteria bacterium]|nr:response regulator transcription factor [Deltaproteobacteria bacterium]